MFFRGHRSAATAESDYKFRFWDPIRR
jgi:hypothetical protein